MLVGLLRCSWAVRSRSASAVFVATWRRRRGTRPLPRRYRALRRVGSTASCGSCSCSRAGAAHRARAARGCWSSHGALRASPCPCGLARPAVGADRPDALARGIARRKRVESSRHQLDASILRARQRAEGGAEHRRRALGAAIVPCCRSASGPRSTALLEGDAGRHTLEQALLDMSARARQPRSRLALSAVLIGRQVGGNLPTVLETTAATIAR